MEVVDNFTLADSVIGKHFLLIQNLFWMLEHNEQEHDPAWLR
jgi:hypothetical protein